jgi:hypothetical protein
MSYLPGFKYRRFLKTEPGIPIQIKKGEVESDWVLADEDGSRLGSRDFEGFGTQDEGVDFYLRFKGDRTTAYIYYGKGINSLS